MLLPDFLFRSSSSKYMYKSNFLTVFGQNFIYVSFFLKTLVWAKMLITFLYVFA
jgi:hypothetical protein